MPLSVPAKAFLFGEYAALQEGPAVIACFSPCFRFYRDSQADLALTPHAPSTNEFHPDSIAGKYQAQHPLAFAFHDPFAGKGGMGASSAEFLGQILLQQPNCDVWQLRETYFSFAEQSANRKRPSGYDVVAQAFAAQNNITDGFVVLEAANRRRLDSSFTLPENSALHIFHTNKKLPTHVHLDNLEFSFDTNAFNSITQEALAAANAKTLGELMNRFHLVLEKFGLVAKHTLDYVHALRQQPDVLGVKGSGAMGSDLLLVLTPSTGISDDWNPVADLEKITILRGRL